MDRNELEDLVRASYRSRQTGDVEAALKYFHPDAEFRIVGSDSLKPLTEKIRGHASLRKVFEIFFPVWDWSKFHVQTIHVDGNTAFVHSSGEMRHSPSGKSMDTEILDRITIKNGLIVDFTEFLDTHLVTTVLATS